MREFWQRWHISLSTWMRDHLYYPLGGNRASTPRLYFNLFTVFILCGLWHGASWMFLLWGTYHGVFLALERGPFGRWVDALPRFFRHTYVLLVSLGHIVMFRIQDADHAWAYYKAMFGLNQGDSVKYSLGHFLNGQLIIVLIFAILGSTPFWYWLHSKIRNYMEGMPRLAGQTTGVVYDSLMVVGVFGLLYVCAAFMSANTFAPFIYFRF